MFVGMGISGGEEGARNGPSLMPGGPKAAYDALHPILERSAAQVEGSPCVTYCGEIGSGTKSRGAKRRAGNTIITVIFRLGWKL